MTYQRITDPFEDRYDVSLDEKTAYVFRSVERQRIGLKKKDLCQLLVTLQGRFHLDSKYLLEPVGGRFDLIYVENKEDAKMLRLKGKVADVEFTLVKSPEAEPAVA